MSNLIINEYILDMVKKNCTNDSIMYKFLKSILEEAENFQWKKAYKTHIEKYIKDWPGENV